MYFLYDTELLTQAKGLVIHAVDIHKHRQTQTEELDS